MVEPELTTAAALDHQLALKIQGRFHRLGLS